MRPNVGVLSRLPQPASADRTKKLSPPILRQQLSEVCLCVCFYSCLANLGSFTRQNRSRLSSGSALTDSDPRADTTGGLVRGNPAEPHRIALSRSMVGLLSAPLFAAAGQNWTHRNLFRGLL